MTVKYCPPSTISPGTGASSVDQLPLSSPLGRRPAGGVGGWMGGWAVSPGGLLPPWAPSL